MPDPLVSVVVATYNQERFIRETLDSVFAQTYGHLQVIVTDDASPDGTVEAVRENYGDRVELITSDVNTGIAANYNRGLRRISGEYLAWLDGDDLMRPDRVQRQLDALRDRPDAAGCFGDAEMLQWPSGDVLGRFTTLANGRTGVREGGVELLFDPTYLMLPSVSMLRTEFLPSHGFDARFPVLIDWLFHIEVFRHGPIVAIDDILGSYRRHGGNASNQPTAMARQLEDQLIVMAVVTARYPELARLALRRAAVLQLMGAKQAVDDHRWREALQRLRAAVVSGGVVGTAHGGGRMGVAMVRRAHARRDVPPF